MGKSGPISAETAEKIAISALVFLAQDPDQLGRFLAISGIDPGAIRAAAADPRFLAGVLDHVTGDEKLLLAVASDAGVPPQEVERAQAVLSGARWEREVP